MLKLKTLFQNKRVIRILVDRILRAGFQPAKKAKTCLLATDKGG
jgi:hypothetical protein